MLGLVANLDVVQLHKGHELVGQLKQHLLVQVAFSYGFVKLNELNDISRCARRLVSIVAIELPHVFKILFANPDNNHGAGQIGQLGQYLLGLGHVVDNAVSNDQEHVVLGLAGMSLAVVLESLENRSEVGRAAKLDARQSLSVRTQDAAHALSHLVVKQVEAVGDFSSSCELGHTPKAEDWELLVVVVGLQGFADRGDGRFVLVAWPHEVETVRFSGLPVGCRVVDGHHLSDLPAASKVVSESGLQGRLRLCLLLLHLDLLVLNHGLASEDDARAFALFEFETKNLLFGAHDFGQVGLAVPHRLSGLVFVSIEDLELELLPLF